MFFRISRYSSVVDPFQAGKVVRNAPVWLGWALGAQPRGLPWRFRALGGTVRSVVFFVPSLHRLTARPRQHVAHSMRLGKSWQPEGWQSPRRSASPAIFVLSNA
jgi:hypothetical protein